MISVNLYKKCMIMDFCVCGREDVRKVGEYYESGSCGGL